MTRNLLEKVKGAIAWIVVGALCMMLLLRRKDSPGGGTEPKDADAFDSAMRERNKIEKADAHSLIDDSGDSLAAQGAVSGKQDEFRERVRVRLESQLHRQGSGGDS